MWFKKSEKVRHKCQDCKFLNYNSINCNFIIKKEKVNFYTGCIETRNKYANRIWFNSDGLCPYFEEKEQNEI